MLYKCMILPVFDYGDVFYNHSTNKLLLKKLQTIQNSAIRIISKLPKRTNTDSEETDLGLLNLVNRRLLHCIQIGASLSQNPNQLYNCAVRNTRTRAISEDRRQFLLFNPKKSVCERSFTYRIRRTWNSLPTEFHTAPDRAALNRLFFSGVNKLFP